MPDDPKNSKRLRADIQQRVNAARLSILEHALVGYVEEIDGHVPTDDEILGEGMHVEMAGVLGIYEHEGHTFHQFYCWRKRHLLAIGFLDEANPLTLYIARVPDDEWPFAVKNFVEQSKGEPGDG